MSGTNKGAPATPLTMRHYFALVDKGASSTTDVDAPPPPVDSAEGKATAVASKKRKGSISARDIRDDPVKAAEAAFSSQTRDTFMLEFPKIKLPSELGGLNPHYHFSQEAAAEFFDIWVPSLFVCDAVLRFGSGEKVKYFPIFSLLGTVALTAGQVARSITVNEGDDEVDVGFEEEGVRKEVKLTTSQLADLFRFLGDEERLKRGNLEFMIFDTVNSTEIEGLVEVKLMLPSSTDMLKQLTSPVWQLYCELARALDQNAAALPSEVWGALTDETTWYFARIRRELDENGQEKTSIQMSDALMLQRSRTHGTLQCTEDTKEVLEFLFTLVHGTSPDPNIYNTQNGITAIHGLIRQHITQAVQNTRGSFDNYKMSGKEAVQKISELSAANQMLTVAARVGIQQYQGTHPAATAADIAAVFQMSEGEVRQYLV
jgi:hypothetical protein